MSGICGIIRFDEQLVKEEEIHNLLNAMQNHGNDAEGVWIKGTVGFGHKALWTTPESVYESHPSISNDGTLILSPDARIDNRKQLINEFDLNEDDNVITDADLIIYSYQRWGEDCAKHLIGDFMFVIWDTKKKRLICIRDHMGIKPFYYFIGNEQFVFTSELSALFEIKNIPKKIDDEAVEKYNEMTALECNKTFYRDIWRIKPAHILILENKQIDLKRYWYPEKISVDYSMSHEEAKSNFKKVLSEAISVRMRTVSGPVGCELSGGLDSSSIVLLANQLTTSKILTFSTTFDGYECDEKDFVDLVLEKTGIKGFYSKFNKKDYLNKYSFRHYYNYSLDWVGKSMFSFSFDIMKKAKEQNVKVMLSGFGSDEIFPDRVFALSDLLRHFHFKKLYRELRSQQKPIHHLIAYGLLPLLPLKVIKFIEIFFSKRLFKHILNTRNEFKYVCYPFEFKRHKSFTELYNLKAIFSNDVDELYTLSMYRFSEKFDLEYRHPFLDKRVIEYILSVPSYYKFSNMIRKSLLRESLKDQLPQSIYMKVKNNNNLDIIHYNIQYYNSLFIKEKIIGIDNSEDSIYRRWIEYELKYWKSLINKKGKKNEKRI